MPAGWHFLSDLLITLGAALILGLLLERLRQNAIVGYLLAGTLVGPSVTGWVRDAEAVATLSEIGVALLLFTIGLEFSLQRLKRLGKVAILGGSLSVALIIFVIFGIAYSFGVPWKAALVMGMIASLGSTAIVLRILKDSSELDATHGKASVGVLLMQDVLMVPLVLGVTVLGGLSAGGSGKGSVAPGQLLLNTGLLVIALVVLVNILMPRVLDARAFARNRELPILTAVTVCMGATIGAQWAGLSPALGAFLAGVLLAETRFSEQFRADIDSLRTLFVTLFFASIGMIVDVRFLAQHWALVLVGTAVVILLKAVLTFAAIKPFTPSIVGGIAAGIALSQIGEFSFVLAKIAEGAGLLDEFQYQAIISISVATLFLTPLLVTGAPKWARRFAMRVLPGRIVAEAERVARLEWKGHVVLVGYGEAGQSVARTLDQHAEHQVKILVMDLDPKLVQQAEECSYRGALSDASQASNLLHARLPEAAMLVIALPDARVTRMIISQAQMIAPHVPVVVRARYHIHAAELDMMGARVVVDEEGLVGKRIADKVFRLLNPKEELPALESDDGVSSR